MRRFTLILAGAYVIGVLAVVAEMYYKFSGERDEAWRSEWLVESCWFSIFTLFVISIMALMRPNSKSKLLALVEELGAENE